MKIRDFILYSVGLCGLVLTGAAALEDPSYTNLGAISASILALLADFLWLAKEETHVGKRTEKASGWGYLKWSGLFLGLVAIPALYHFLPSSDRKIPNLDIAWYKFDHGLLKLSDPSAVAEELTPEDILANRLRVPVRLAIRNSGADPLNVTRVELSYDSSIKVVSSGKAKIDPKGGILIYEHNIGTLESQNEFTPIEEIDVLEIPFKFFFVQAVALTQDEVPMRIGTLVGQDVFGQKKIEFRVRVFSQDRPPALGKVSVTPVSGVQLFSEGDYERQVSSSYGDADYFSVDLPKTKSISTWERVYSNSSKLIGYELFQSPKGKVRRVSVDGIFRSIAVDQNNDGDIDFLLVKGKPNNNTIRLDFISRYPLLDWEPEEVSG